ncbi:MAG: TetR/AcrR family transcriptional regulator, partial [Clostridia bacterium]|nr:TetR/AcrR family transcriptional regulator [Clostridia bacterium]
MPPKVKITKKDIIKTALELVEQNGDDSLNARSIAAALNCSTQPVFSNFQSMEELQREVVNAAYEKYMDFLRREAESGKYPEYKAIGM